MKKCPVVFVGSSKESIDVAFAVQENLEDAAEVRLWNQNLFRPSENTIDELIRFSKEFDFGIFIWNDDDILTSRGENYFSPRDNVIFETGIFLGSLGKKKVFILIPENKVKIPSDLYGLTTICYKKPSDGNYKAALASAVNQIKKSIKNLCQEQISKESFFQGFKTYKNSESAWNDMKEDCKNAEVIKITGIRGIRSFGTDHSLISMADIKKYKNLKKIRIILLSSDARWINKGFIKLREYESIDAFKNELSACHKIIESCMNKLQKKILSTKSGVRYHKGEPKFGIVMTEKVAYVISYASSPNTEVIHLPVYRFENFEGSLYSGFKRHFGDLWHNKSFAGNFNINHIDYENEAGGILIARKSSKNYVALLRREDGYWVLPKGHKLNSKEEINQTALREVSEETGISQSDFYIEKKLGYYGYEAGNGDNDKKQIVHVFLLKCNCNIFPELINKDYLEVKWWDLSKPLPEMLYSQQENFLSKVKQNIVY